MKNFSTEIEIMFKRLKSGKNFSFSKYADGEWSTLSGNTINNGEFDFNPERGDPVQELMESFTFKDNDYYVGISCPCCQGLNHNIMKKTSQQQEDNLTFANLFVNNNYKFFTKNFVPEFSNHKIHLVANKRSKIENLPFEIEEFYPVGFSAWVNDYSLVEEIMAKNLKEKLFLFCCGPFGNILAHKLWESNKNNTYMDIGSTLNPWLQSEAFVRGYFSGPNSEKICVWT